MLARKVLLFSAPTHLVLVEHVLCYEILRFECIVRRLEQRTRPGARKGLFTQMSDLKILSQRLLLLYRYLGMVTRDVRMRVCTVVMSANYTCFDVVGPNP